MGSYRSPLLAPRCVVCPHADYVVNPLFWLLVGVCVASSICAIIAYTRKARAFEACAAVALLSLVGVVVWLIGGDILVRGHCVDRC